MTCVETELKPFANIFALLLPIHQLKVRELMNEISLTIECVGETVSQRSVVLPANCKKESKSLGQCMKQALYSFIPWV